MVGSWELGVGSRALAAQAPADPQVTFRLIVVSSADHAQSLLSDIGAGASFETIARTQSSDPSAGQGGLIGPVALSELRLSVDQDPRAARRLAVMRKMAGLAETPLAIRARVPDFTLIDHTRQRVSLSSLAGKVLVVNFIYTRCASPQFCLRVTNNFGVLQKRFAKELGKDVVLLTITFDPQRDTPEALAAYAAQWKPDPKAWHFLTGSVADVRKVCALFGVEYFPDEGLMNHSLRTAVIDRKGSLVASIEGITYSPKQLGDLVFTHLTS